jgi:Zn-dependent peptidase ImmA (M78 family)
MSRYLSDLRVGQIRRAAIDLLKKYHVATPDAIDLDTLVWLIGRLRIRVGGLEGAEGRLVATDDDGGVIRVASQQNLGRYRFTIAHELGHYVLHRQGVLDKVSTRRDMTIWNDASEEAEANLFAAELLMPEFLFKSCCVGTPSIALLDGLAEVFRTSVLATAFQYCEYTREPVALVLSEGWRMKSFRPFKAGWPRIRYGEIHRDSAAGERLDGRSVDSRRMVRSPAYAWLEGFEDRPDKDIMEDSRYLEYYDKTLTLLWQDESLDDDAE